ncbi:neuropeptide Y receptor type 1-like isoform X2 [Oculina patagonica]
MMFANNSSTTNLDEEEFQSHNAQNGTCLLPIDFVAIMISYVTIYSALLIASLVGNTLLIYASLKSNLTMNLVMANIAASDLLFSIVHLPREIVVQIKKSTAFVVHGTIGQLLCKMCAFVADVTIAVSTLSLVLITADSLETRNGEAFCITNWEPAFNHELTHTRYYTALLVTVLIVPLVAVSLLQTITLLKLRNDEMAPFRTSIVNQRHKKRNKKLLKMSTVIVLAFASCWLPFLVLQFLHLYFSSAIPHCSLGFGIFGQFAILFSLCHCVVNPCICLTFMRRIRKNLSLKSINTITRKKSSTDMETRI